MHTVREVTTKEQAIKVGQFLTSTDAFDQTWAPKEKAMVQKAPQDSLINLHHKYWFVESSGQVVGAIGIRENKYGDGGYVMDDDYTAVHRDFRRQGIASLLMGAVESYVKSQGGRYIHILTCDIDSYQPARAFYEKFGYALVAKIPDYYVVGEGRIDYFKKI